MDGADEVAGGSRSDETGISTAASDRRRRRVGVISLGGTIAMARRTAGGVVPSLSGAELVAAVPGLEEIAELDVVSLTQVPGAHLSFGHLRAVIAQAERAVASGADGVVVTQGTDTIADTAFLLDLTLRSTAAVVVTGAMRGPSTVGSDGAANLLASVTVASSPEAAGLGVLVVLNDEIHAARFVQKTHTSNPGAFVSYPGPLGWMSEGRPLIVVTPRGRCRRLPAPTEDTPQVALVTTAIGDDGGLLRSLVGAGFAGVVVETLGGGHVGPPVADALGELCRSVPVVVCSRVRCGELLRSTYGFVGSESDLAQRGVVSGGFLDGPKARILLLALLAAGASAEEVAATFSDPFPAAAAGRRRK